MSDYTSISAAQHREQGPLMAGCAVLTVSDTRTMQEDRGGQTICQLLTDAGQSIVEYQIVPDDRGQLQKAVQTFVGLPTVDAILVTGGTGIARRDQTPETLEALFSKSIPGYGELFRMLSYQEIGSAALLSRAAGGLIDQTVVLTMPGSPAAVRLAMEKLVLPELAHLVDQARR